MKKSVLASIVGVSSIGMLKGLSGSKSILSFFGLKDDLIRIDFSFQYKYGSELPKEIPKTIPKMMRLSQTNLAEYWDEDEHMWDYHLFLDSNLPDLEEYGIIDPEDIYNLKGSFPVRAEIIKAEQVVGEHCAITVSFYFNVNEKTIGMTKKNFLAVCESIVRTASICVYENYDVDSELRGDTFEFVESNMSLPIINYTNTSIRRY